MARLPGLGTRQLKTNSLTAFIKREAAANASFRMIRVIEMDKGQ